MNHNQYLGAAGEAIAAEYLQHRGMRILATNWRCSQGELDIIAEHRGSIIAVEVKTRTSTDYGHPAQAVTAAKLRRLCVLTRCWCRENHRSWTGARIDVIAILLHQGTKPHLEHYKGVEA
ncbi:YraN family protein [Paeniglutamicibacter cryotolerans]|uniref:UPF0102 protein E9229_003608 n=1 Tax=Paeniglutamicibacter cryotolerans TaxID=670079 RepID=A0A839QZG4_9MICC|nr:YraN family protein [Paeniglutamicibacter cryotolerans]MBB2997361.1 putative endonuclease [Paeniglutamicibacter cryotolerans]